MSEMSAPTSHNLQQANGVFQYLICVFSAEQYWSEQFHKAIDQTSMYLGNDCSQPNTCLKSTIYW